MADSGVLSRSKSLENYEILKMKTMKKYRIYETGRLSNSEISRINGGECGRYHCPSYTVTDCNGGYGVCSGGYLSCLDRDLSCGNYSGPVGPGGYTINPGDLKYEKKEYYEAEL